MKTFKNFIFVESDMDSVEMDCSDGYLKGFTQEDEKRIKLPHNNFELLGIVDECVNSGYAEEFSKEIVDIDEHGNYLDYETEWNTYNLASDSFQTLARVLNLKPTDYILRDDDNT
jgi:predicted nucleic-acid-binding Zn-ribbon protein